jgi:hypothetical protein
VSRTPPTGCMSWQTFRCETGCADFPAPYTEQADALVSTGLLDAAQRRYTSMTASSIAEAETRKRISFDPPDPLSVWLQSGS